MLISMGLPCASNISHHIVSNELQVSHVDVNFVGAENATNLLQDCGARHLNSVSCKDFINIVRVNVVKIEYVFFDIDTISPKTMQVRAIRDHLRKISVSVNRLAFGICLDLSIFPLILHSETVHDTRYFSNNRFSTSSLNNADQ